MGGILDQLLTAALSPQEALAIASPDMLASLALAVGLLLLAISAAFLRQAALAMGALMLAAVMLALQVLDVAAQWRAMGLASLTALTVLMVVLHERGRISREIERELLDLNARFDSFLTALDRRHALMDKPIPQREGIISPPTAPSP